MKRNPKGYVPESVFKQVQAELGQVKANHQSVCEQYSEMLDKLQAILPILRPSDSEPPPWQVANAIVIEILGLRQKLAAARRKRP